MTSIIVAISVAAAIFLAANDLHAFRRGAPSVAGDIVEAYEQLGLLGLLGCVLKRLFEKMKRLGRPGGQNAD